MNTCRGLATHSAGTLLPRIGVTVAVPLSRQELCGLRNIFDPVAKVTGKSVKLSVIRGTLCCTEKTLLFNKLSCIIPHLSSTPPQYVSQRALRVVLISAGSMLTLIEICPSSGSVMLLAALTHIEAGMN